MWSHRYLYKIVESVDILSIVGATKVATPEHYIPKSVYITGDATSIA